MLTDSRSALRNLFAAAGGVRGDRTDALILADCLEDLAASDLAARLRGTTRPMWILHEVRRACFERGLLCWEDEPSHQKALACQQALAAVDLAGVPVLTTDRHIERKAQAALLRKLLRQLKVPHVSVTAPNYSMASSVDVRLPKREDYTVAADGCIDRDCPAAVANRAAEDTLRSILAIAFPNHDDRSDSQTDYFDYCWSIS